MHVPERKHMLHAPRVTPAQQWPLASSIYQIWPESMQGPIPPHCGYSAAPLAITQIVHLLLTASGPFQLC